METDASDGVMAGVLVQKHPGDDDWHQMLGKLHNF